MRKSSWFLLILIVLFGCTEEIVDPSKPPVDGINYYQLVQFDFDGKSQEHPIFSTYRSSDLYFLPSARISNITYTTDSDGFWEDDVWATITPNDTLGTGNTINISEGTSVWNYTLTLGNNNTLNIDGELDLETLTVGNNTTINISSTGTLIVRGQVNGGNALDITAGGVLVVGGFIDAGSNSGIDNTGGNTFVCGSESSIITSGYPNKTCTDLLNEFPEISDKLSVPLPISLLYQKAELQSDGSILITYETVSERNSNYVLLNWSDDGENWYTITTFRSFNKPSIYTFLHK